MKDGREKRFAGACRIFLPIISSVTENTGQHVIKNGRALSRLVEEGANVIKLTIRIEFGDAGVSAFISHLVDINTSRPGLAVLCFCVATCHLLCSGEYCFSNITGGGSFTLLACRLPATLLQGYLIRLPYSKPQVSLEFILHKHR